MMAQNVCQIWDLWIADVGAVGVSFARGRLNPTDVLLAHAAPGQLNIEVAAMMAWCWREAMTCCARPAPPSRGCAVRATSITREDIWPTEADYGTPVILPGGEVGILQHWWNAPDHQEWRWRWSSIIIDSCIDNCMCSGCLID